MPEPEGAIFESTRVAPRRDRTPILAAAALLAIGGLAVVGLSGRDLGSGPGAGGLGSGAGAVASGRSPGTQALATAPPATPAATDEVEVTFAPAPVAGPQMTSEPGPIQLSARRQPNSVFVHGDVFVPDVTWVFVSLQDAGGRVAGWASVSVPGAAGPGIDGGPTLRFDVELAAAYVNFPGALALQATAYDGSGRAVASSTIEDLRPWFAVPAEVGAPSSSGAPGGAVSRGFRPGAHFPMLDADWGDEP